MELDCCDTIGWYSRLPVERARNLDPIVFPRIYPIPVAILALLEPSGLLRLNILPVWLVEVVKERSRGDRCGLADVLFRVGYHANHPGDRGG